MSDKKTKQPIGGHPLPVPPVELNHPRFVRVDASGASYLLSGDDFMSDVPKMSGEAMPILLGQGWTSGVVIPAGQSWLVLMTQTTPSRKKRQKE